MSSLKIFIASPGDVIDEREVLSNVIIPEVRRIFNDNNLIGKSDQIDIESIRWETHAWPDVGEDAQDVINKQIGEYDIFIGIMWKRFGTPTKRSDSGTGEEFERAFKYFKEYNRPKIMFYFKTHPFYLKSIKEINQFKKVIQFRKKLEDLGVLFWEYETNIEFERNVREHLIRTISASFLPNIPIAFDKKDIEKKKPISKELDHEPHPSLKKIKLFILYSHLDIDTVNNVLIVLRNNGFDPWLDREKLLPGQNWKNEVRDKMKTSDVILVFISEKSKSKPGYINNELSFLKNELNIRYKRIKEIIPIRLDPIDPDPFLRRFQWVDLFKKDGIEKLLESLLNYEAEYYSDNKPA